MTKTKKKLSASDADLIRRYIDNGCNRSFNELVERHRPKMFNHILFTVKDEDLAHDLYQDALVKVVLMLREGRYQEEGKFGAWVMRLTNNIIMDYFRKKPAGGGSFVSTDTLGTDVLNKSDLSVQPVEQTMIDAQTEKEAVKLMNALPETQREILELRFFKDLTFKEIAEMKGMSINTALGRMHYAVNNMRKMARKSSIAAF